MDDVDAVQGQIARNMLQSGDWVTARLDGVAYLEKSPLKYWTMVLSYRLFGVHDWAARIPIALATVLLCWVLARFAAWAFGWRAGLAAGLVLATSVGLFLFTRVLIPDVMLTLAITTTLWSLLRALDAEESRPGLWAMLMWAAVGIGLLLKGLVAVVLPAGAAVLYLGFTGGLNGKTCRRLRPLPGVALALTIAAPWHVLATLHNPPYFDFTLHSEAGSYHGFFWFYFINEQLLRFLNLRYPRDYNTVPRLYFWLFHLLWLFPWSVYFPAAWKLSYRAPERASRVRLMALCWCAAVLGFFTFSTTQEYYSMPCYPALALLVGSALAEGGGWIRWGTRIAAAVAAAAALVIAAILWLVRGMPAPGDISAALTQNPDIYTLSLGHMTDLTLRAFAYLRAPLALAGAAFLIGAVGAWRAQRQSGAGASPGQPVGGRNRLPHTEPLSWPQRRLALGSLAVMMVLFFHAARLALVVFDPYLSSRPLAEALNVAPPGKLIVDDQYYTFSSIFFYTNRRALLLNGRVNNLEYGSYAPDAPRGTFITDRDLLHLWTGPERYYLVVEAPRLPQIARLLGNSLVTVKTAGDKFLLTNTPLNAPLR